MSTPTGVSNTIIQLDMGEFGQLEGCITCSPPQPSLDVPAQYVWDGKGKPLNINGSGKITWSDWSVTFLGTGDSFDKAHQALIKAHDDPDGSKQDCKITIQDKKGATVRIYNCKASLLKSVTSTDLDANGSQFVTGTLTGHSEDVEITK